MTIGRSFSRRMDKYYMLIRRFVNATFRLLMRTEWDIAVITEYNHVLTSPGCPLWYVLFVAIPVAYSIPSKPWRYSCPDQPGLPYSRCISGRTGQGFQLTVGPRSHACSIVDTPSTSLRCHRKNDNECDVQSYASRFPGSSTLYTLGKRRTGRG